MPSEFVQLARPVTRFLGHSLAAALGFCLLGLILLLPIAFLRLLTWLDFDDLAKALKPAESALLYFDLLLFGITFSIGALEFVILEVRAAWSSISKDP